MKKKGMLIFTFLMLLCNTLTMYYVSQALKQEINIYVVQVGRYKEKANAENTGRCDPRDGGRTVPCCPLTD